MTAKPHDCGEETGNLANSQIDLDHDVYAMLTLDIALAEYIEPADSALRGLCTKCYCTLPIFAETFSYAAIIDHGYVCRECAMRYSPWKLKTGWWTLVFTYN